MELLHHIVKELNWINFIENYNMPKTKFIDIIKNGEELEVRKLDLNDPEVIEMFRRVKEEQEKILERKKVDWGKLRDTVIDI